jgi:hypothetical protein
MSSGNSQKGTRVTIMVVEGLVGEPRRPEPLRPVRGPGECAPLVEGAARRCPVSGVLRVLHIGANTSTNPVLL